MVSSRMLEYRSAAAFRHVHTSMHRFGRAVIHGLVLSAACHRGPVAPAGIPARASGVPRNGLEVIGAMRVAHPSRALRTLSYTVRVSEYRPDSVRTSRSRVYASLPGRHRVEYLPTSRRSGYVRDRQRLAVFESGVRVSQATRVDLVALVAYDLFAQSIDTTIMWLDSSAVRFGLLRLDELDGRRVWVVGAPAGDTTSSQFWVDATEFRVVRVIQREPVNSNAIVDMRFTDFIDVLDVPLPTRIAVYRGGKLAQRHEISAVATNPRLPARAFDLSRWRALD